MLKNLESSFIGFLVFVILNILLSFYEPNSKKLFVGKIMQTFVHDDHDRNETKHILIWTSDPSDVNWGFQGETLDADFLMKMGCPEHRCLITKNKRLIKEHHFDAIFFHGSRVNQLTNVPSMRSPHQVYIFGLTEAPSGNLELNSTSIIFNMTMTHRMDSDIIWTHQKILDIETDTHVAPLKELAGNWANVDKIFFDPTTYSEVITRKRRILSFVDDCDLLRKHKTFLEELNKDIPIDIYGPCGDHKCIDDCEEILNSTYKFHLILDSSDCVEHVPQKLIDYRYYFTIPIIMGSDNLKYFLPPQSYINFNDFGTMKDFVNHLKGLMDNSMHYLNTFWWMKYYKYDSHNSFCDLCERLHDPNFEERMQYYNDISEWWNEGICMNSKLEENHNDL